MSDRYGFPIVVLTFFVLAFALPMIRMRLSSSTWGLVTKADADPFQPVVHRSLKALFAGAAVLAVVHLAIGPERVGVWDVPAPVAYGGYVMAGVGTVLMMAAQVNMGSSWRIGIQNIKVDKTELVTTGLYALVRNPIYTGLFMALAGAVMIAPSAWSIMGTALAAVVISLQVRAEESHLLARHGERFAAYMQRVGRFVPRVN